MVAVRLVRVVDDAVLDWALDTTRGNRLFQKRNQAPSRVENARVGIEDALLAQVDALERGADVGTRQRAGEQGKLRVERAQLGHVVRGDERVPAEPVVSPAAHVERLDLPERARVEVVRLLGSLPLRRRTETGQRRAANVERRQITHGAPPAKVNERRFRQIDVPENERLEPAASLGRRHVGQSRKAIARDVEHLNAVGAKEVLRKGECGGIQIVVGQIEPVDDTVAGLARLNVTPVNGHVFKAQRLDPSLCTAAPFGKRSSDADIAAHVEIRQTVVALAEIARHVVVLQIEPLQILPRKVGRNRARKLAVPKAHVLQVRQIEQVAEPVRQVGLARVKDDQRLEPVNAGFDQRAAHGVV